MTATSTVVAVSDVELAVAAYFQALELMARGCATGSHLVADGVASSRTGLPVPAFNGVWGVERQVSASAVLDAVDVFLSDDLPWNLQLRPGYPAALDESLAERGLVETALIPFMVLTDPNRLAAAAAGSGVTVRRAETFNDYDGVLQALEQGFGMPPELTRGVFPLRLLLLPTATTWLAEASGEPVATGGAMRLGETCGIFNVATPAQHRRRGLGAAVTARSVLADLEQGARLAYLQSSPMGYGVYERLGFVTVERWQQWMLAEYVHPA
jgi:hypothetical protein